MEGKKYSAEWRKTSDNNGKEKAADENEKASGKR